MTDRIFDERLQDQMRNLRSQTFGGNVKLDSQPVGKTLLFDFQITADEFDLFFQTD